MCVFKALCKGFFKVLLMHLKIRSGTLIAVKLKGFSCKQPLVNVPDKRFTVRTTRALDQSFRDQAGSLTTKFPDLLSNCTVIILTASLSNVSEKGKTTVPTTSPVIKQQAIDFILHKQAKATRQETNKAGSLSKNEAFD